MALGMDNQPFACLQREFYSSHKTYSLISVVMNYTDMKELDVTVMREFIGHIEVSRVDRKSKTREITIGYIFIGAFDFSRAIEEVHHSNQKQQETEWPFEPYPFLLQWFLNSPSH